jgi:hypothetical protein
MAGLLMNMESQCRFITIRGPVTGSLTRHRTSKQLHRALTQKEIHEQITAYVNERFDEQEYRKKIEGHVNNCPECRISFEEELKTRMVERPDARQNFSSDAVAGTLSGQTSRLSSGEKSSPATLHPAGDESWLSRFAGNCVSSGGILFALFLVLGGAALLIYPPAGDSGSTSDEPSFVVSEGAPVIDTSTSTRPQNYFNKSSKNFQAIREHKFPLGIEASDNAALKQYFQQQNVGYDVQFPTVTIPLAGGVVSQHGSTRLAHILYAKDDTMIYIFEVPEQLLRQGNVMYVTEDVMQRLSAGEKIWVEESGRSSQVTFKQGDVIMNVTANVPRTTLYVMLGMKD